MRAACRPVLRVASQTRGQTAGRRDEPSLSGGGEDVAMMASLFWAPLCFGRSLATKRRPLQRDNYTLCASGPPNWQGLSLLVCLCVRVYVTRGRKVGAAHQQAQLLASGPTWPSSRGAKLSCACACGCLWLASAAPEPWEYICPAAQQWSPADHWAMGDWEQLGATGTIAIQCNALAPSSCGPKRDWPSLGAKLAANDLFFAPNFVWPAGWLRARNWACIVSAESFNHFCARAKIRRPPPDDRRPSRAVHWESTHCILHCFGLALHYTALLHY